MNIHSLTNHLRFWQSLDLVALVLFMYPSSDPNPSPGQPHFLWGITPEAKFLDWKIILLKTVPKALQKAFKICIKILNLLKFSTYSWPIEKIWGRLLYLFGFNGVCVCVGVCNTGGWQQQMTFQHHMWNLKKFYRMLQNNGFHKDHIKTFFAGNGQLPGRIYNHIL